MIRADGNRGLLKASVLYNVPILKFYGEIYASETV